MESNVVSIPQTASDDAHRTLGQVVANNRPARSLNPHRMPTWIFKTRAHQIAFIRCHQRLVSSGGVHQAGMISDRKVQASIGPKGDLVCSVLAGGSLELSERLALFQLAVAVLVDQTIETRSFGSLARHVDVAIERQQTLNVLHQIAIRLRRVRDTILVRVVHQNQSATFDRSDDMPKLVECHGHERTDLGVSDLFNCKPGDDRETLGKRILAIRNGLCGKPHRLWSWSDRFGTGQFCIALARIALAGVALAGIALAGCP